MDFHLVGRENISKEQICRIAQTYCDSSYTLPEPGKQYTAWSNMKTLLEKGYAYKRGAPAKYSLTETGIDIAKRLKESGVQATGGSSQAGPSTSRASINEDVLESFNRNPSTARASSRRNGAAAILDQMSESYDPSADEVDMSLYVLNPSQHQSISINGRTAGNGVSATSSSSSTPARAIEINDEPDTPQSSAGANGSAKRQKTATGTGTGTGAGTGRGRGRGRGRGKSTSSSSTRGKSKGGRAASYLDRLGDMGELDTGPDMSQYVLNPSEHQSISVNGRTSHNNGTASTNPTSTPRLNSSQSKSTIRPDVVPALSSLSSSNTNIFSSITNSNRSSFARRMMSAAANENSDDEISISSPSSSSQKTNQPKKYTTPSSSNILKKFDKRRTYEDDDNIDLTPSSLPILQSSQIIPPDNIVDLLSSPELSPVLQPANGQSSFPTNFDLENDYFPVSQSLTKKITDETFHYTYLNSTGDAVRSSAKAVITVDESNHCLAYQIRFYTDQRDHPKCKDVIKISIDDTHIGCSVGYISEFGMESICPGLPARPVLPLHREEPDTFWPESRGDIENSQRSVNSLNSQPSQNGYSQTSFSRPSSQLGSQTGLSQPSSQQLGSQTSFTSQTQTQQVDYSQLVENTSLECLLPGEYEIVLVLDNREVQMKTDRAYFQRKLAEKGVKCVTRSLDLGDVIWVARKKNSSNDSEELFLDYVIERKRLDDLITSIKDGRYVEQKTRLRVCGAEKVIYLVEEYNREAVVNQSVLAVQTVMSSLQITEGFYLRRTDSIDETITFLVSATKLMNRIYQGTTLYSIPGEIITRQNYLDLKSAFKEKHNGEKSAFLIKYPLYGELNSKNGSTTVGEVYLRMLMTIRGVNMERATSLSKIYPTPHALLKAFQGKTEEEGKMLAKDATRTHIARRRWTNTASEQLYNVWGAGTYPESVGDDEDDDY